MDIAISSISAAAVAILKLYTTTSPSRTLHHLSRIKPDHVPPPLQSWLRQYSPSAHFLLMNSDINEDAIDTHPTTIPLGRIAVSHRWSHALANT